jgi:hypothetical protein
MRCLNDRFLIDECLSASLVAAAKNHSAQTDLPWRARFTFESL